MSHALDSTMGVWLISFSISTLMYGTGMLQVWLYFHWYPHDRWGIKSVVLLLVVIESVQVAVSIYSLYSRLVAGFGDYEALFEMRWDILAQLLPTYLAAFVVQLYFAQSIYALNKNLKYGVITALIVLLSLVEIGAGIATTVKGALMKSLEQIPEVTDIITTQSGAGVVCDIFITVALCVALRNHRTGMAATNSMLNLLVVNAVNRGLLTAVGAGLNFILFLAIPNTFFFYIGLLPSSRLYMNSMMATLNSRQHIRETAMNSSGRPWDSFQISNLSGDRRGDRGSNAAKSIGKHGVDSETLVLEDVSGHRLSGMTKKKTLDFAEMT